MNKKNDSLLTVSRDCGIYISGKISGTKENNYPKFAAVEKELRERYGFTTVIVPHHLYSPTDEPRPWKYYMNLCVSAVVNNPDVKAVVVLDDWHESDGATLELVLFMSLGLQVFNANLENVSMDIVRSISRSRGAVMNRIIRMISGAKR